MTNIDHDALARRIATVLMSGHDEVSRSELEASRLKLYGGHGFQVSSWTIDPLTQCIGSVLREALPTSEEACEWTGSEWEMIGKWDTSCGKSYYVVDDEPGENGFRFCCYCGKKLIEVPFEDDEDFES